MGGCCCCCCCCCGFRRNASMGHVRTETRFDRSIGLTLANGPKVMLVLPYDDDMDTRPQ